VVEANRVDRATVNLDLEVQMWPGGLAAVTDFGDWLPSLDLLARWDEVPVVMPVLGSSRCVRVRS
jgi:hypothetical protein